MMCVAAVGAGECLEISGGSRGRAGARPPPTIGHPMNI
jgi:hypothetical protein